MALRIARVSMAAWALVIAALLPVAGVQAQAQAPAGDAQRTPWGDPDLQGVWVGSTLTPLERPEQFADREFLTAEEMAALEQGAVDRNARLYERPAENTTVGGSVDWRDDGTPGFYNNFWLDNGTAWEPSGRTSLIVDPPDGRIPYTATAEDGYRPHGSGPWNSFLDLDTGERCLGDGLPQIWLGYNPNHQIFQKPGPRGNRPRDVQRAAHHPPRRPAARRHRTVERRAARTLGGRHARGRVARFPQPPPRPLDQYLAHPVAPDAPRRALHPRGTPAPSTTRPPSPTPPSSRARGPCTCPSRRTRPNAAWRLATSSNLPATRATTPSATSSAAPAPRTPPSSRRPPLTKPASQAGCLRIWNDASVDYAMIKPVFGLILG